MATLCLLLLSTALIHTAQPVPAGRSSGRVLNVGGVRRDRRDIRAMLPYEGQMMSYPSPAGGGGSSANDVYYQSDNWRGRGLDQALQRLVERDQRQERRQEEEEAAYLASLLRLLSEAESAVMVRPEEEDQEEEEEDQGPPGDFQGGAPPDYEETSRGLSMGRPRPPAAWWGVLEPQLAQALVERLEPQLAQALLERANQERLQQERLQQAGRTDRDALRRLVARTLLSISPDDGAVMSSAHRSKRDLSITTGRSASISSAHRRARRSLEEMDPLSPSNDPPLLRVKRLEEEERGGDAPTGLQRMKRIDTTATDEEQNYGSRRRRRRDAANYDTQILIQHILEYMKE